MRICEITKETFLPKTPDHFFKNEDAFNEFLDEMDSTEKWEKKQGRKREINWEPKEKECKQCHEVFLAHHPATLYCDRCQTERANETRHREEGDSTQEGEDGKTGYVPTIKKCSEPGCDNLFLATHWLMKKCEKHSPRGGKIVEG